jgi:hypothetical protein
LPAGRAVPHLGVLNEIKWRASSYILSDGNMDEFFPHASLIRTDADTLDGDVFTMLKGKRARVRAISSIALPTHPQRVLRARTHHSRVYTTQSPRFDLLYWRGITTGLFAAAIRDSVVSCLAPWRQDKKRTASVQSPKKYLAYKVLRFVLHIDVLA